MTSTTEPKEIHPTCQLENKTIYIPSRPEQGIGIATILVALENNKDLVTSTIDLVIYPLLRENQVNQRKYTFTKPKISVVQGKKIPV